MSDGLLDQLERSRNLGFLGDGPLAAHVDHATAVLDAARECVPSPDATLIDMGSGGGIPGLVAVASGRWARVVLLDRSARRCAFLRSAIAGLGGSEQAVVVCSTAEAAGRAAWRERADAVVARSFGPPAATLECASGLVRVHGAIVVSDPPGGRAWPDLACLGLELVGSTAADPARSVFRKVRPLAPELPRRDGIPVQRPLFSLDP